MVFIFLGDWRSTPISAIAIPVSLIGTFLFMQFFHITQPDYPFCTGVGHRYRCWQCHCSRGCACQNGERGVICVQSNRGCDTWDQQGDHRYHISHGGRVYTGGFYVGTGWYILPAVLHYHVYIHCIIWFGGFNADAGTLRSTAENTHGVKSNNPLTKLFIVLIIGLGK